MSKIYKSTKGALVDIANILEQNETKVAAGNMRVNARGDDIGKGGAIIRTVKKKAQASHNMAKEVRSVGLGKTTSEEVFEGTDTKKEEKQAKPKAKEKARPKKEVEMPDGSIEMVDDDGDE